MAGLGIGLIRKALFIATLGLSGRVFKDSSKQKPATKAAAKGAGAPRRATAKGSKQQAVKRPKPARTATRARSAASRKGTAAELERLAKLHRQGALSNEEFAAGKAKILGTSPPTRERSRAPHNPDGTPQFEALDANVTAARRLADLAGQRSEASELERPALDHSPVATLRGQ